MATFILLALSSTAFAQAGVKSGRAMRNHDPKAGMTVKGTIGTTGSAPIVHTRQ